MSDCASCNNKACRNGADCYEIAEGSLKILAERPELEKLHRTATAIEGRHYLDKTRLEEIILFARELAVKKIGLAFCIGLSQEAQIIGEILSKHFAVSSVCCKCGGISKDDMGFEKIQTDRLEVMCNPVAQAMLLNRDGTDLNVLCGLCVGHDAVFSKVSDAPVVTLIAKDRVLAHNPAAAIYCDYIRRRFT